MCSCLVCSMSPSGVVWNDLVEKWMVVVEAKASLEFFDSQVEAGKHYDRSVWVGGGWCGWVGVGVGCVGGWVGVGGGGCVCVCEVFDSQVEAGRHYDRSVWVWVGGCGLCGWVGGCGLRRWVWGWVGVGRCGWVGGCLGR